MSRIGNASIVLLPGVSASDEGGSVVVKGPKGEIRVDKPAGLSVVIDGPTLTVHRDSEAKHTRALHGFFRATLANAVTGVSAGWSRTLELSGVGYRASMSGASLVLNLGFSHPVTVAPPEGITFAVTEGTIVVSGVNNQEVGAIAAKIRAIKKPEPYKGKGIKYKGEHIRKKAGKAKAVGGAPGAK